MLAFLRVQGRVLVAFVLLSMEFIYLSILISRKPLRILPMFQCLSALHFMNVHQAASTLRWRISQESKPKNN